MNLSKIEKDLLINAMNDALADLAYITAYIGTSEIHWPSTTADESARREVLIRDRLDRSSDFFGRLVKLIKSEIPDKPITRKNEQCRSTQQSSTD